MSSRNGSKQTLQKSGRGGTTPSKSTSRTTLPTLAETPSLASRKWEEQPSKQELGDALTRLSLEVQPDILDDQARKKALYARLRKREYSKGEILYAVDELADDPELDEKLRYGGDLSAADFRRVIEPIRETRRRLKGGKILTEEEVWQAVETIPELAREDFGECREATKQRRFILKSEAHSKLDHYASSDTEAT